MEVHLLHVARLNETLHEHICAACVTSSLHSTECLSHTLRKWANDTEIP